MSGDSRLLRGIGVSPGCVIGPAYVVHWTLPEVPDRVILPSEADAELARFRRALKAVQDHIADLRDRTEQRAGEDAARIFDAQILMLEDVELVKDVEGLIRENQLGAERAFEFKALELASLWAQSGNPVLRQRRADLYGIGIRVLRQLLGKTVEDLLQGRGTRPVVVLTRELTPGLTVEFDRQHLAGFASVEGTRTAHAAILAHSLGIPCVMGVAGGLDLIEPETEVVLDGTRGTLLIRPTTAQIEEAEAFEAKRLILQEHLADAESLPSETTDGEPITLRSNLDLPEELDMAVSHGAAGVGLLRTEFLIVGRARLPTEDEQHRYFARVARAFPEQPVVIRSYDLGGDKFPAAFRGPREPNPFLGWRAIRVCLDEPDLFRVQLRAVLRARLEGDIQLMLPLVTQLDEVRRTRELLADEVANLEREGVPHAPDLPVGVMIETPAAAMLADEFAAESDFLSVGTNDLTQYVLAVDRGNARLAERFTPFHPAVVRMLRMVADAGSRAGHRVSVCGEMASEPLAALLLLSLGYTTLSVAPPRLSVLHWIVRQLDAGGARAIAPDLTGATTTAGVLDVLREGMGGAVDLDLLGSSPLPDPKAQTSLRA